jgi:hypothetical protein
VIGNKHLLGANFLDTDGTPNWIMKKKAANNVNFTQKQEVSVEF